MSNSYNVNKGQGSWGNMLNFLDENGTELHRKVEYNKGVPYCVKKKPWTL